MRGKAVFCYLAAYLDLGVAKYQCVLLLLCQVEQAFARRFLILIAGNQNRCIWVSCQSRRVPGAWSSCEHTATGKNARWWPCQDAFAILGISHECHVSPGERCISPADLPL